MTPYDLLLGFTTPNQNCNR